MLVGVPADHHGHHERGSEANLLLVDEMLDGVPNSKVPGLITDNGIPGSLWSDFFDSLHFKINKSRVIPNMLILWFKL